MPNYSVFDKTGKKVSDIALSDAIFAITPNASAMHLCVVAYLANQRQGTQSTLTRAEVRGGGEGKSPIGRPGPCTPWGKPALGYKTRNTKKASDKLIVKRRNGK